MTRRASIILRFCYAVGIFVITERYQSSTLYNTGGKNCYVRFSNTVPFFCASRRTLFIQESIVVQESIIGFGSRLTLIVVFFTEMHINETARNHVNLRGKIQNGTRDRQETAERTFACGSVHPTHGQL